MVQLVQEHTPIPVFLQDMYKKHQSQYTHPSLSDLLTALSKACKLYTRVYIVPDALDECSDETRWELMEKLREIEPQIHLLVTSRHRDSIEEEARNFERLEIKANKADLEQFVDHNIRKNKNLKRVVE